ncbi:MAG: hypothetical protein FWF31_04350 [Desulfobulbus sp.]|nr:hypothetical protein [Desulfobulbus sp.]
MARTVARQQARHPSARLQQETRPCCTRNNPVFLWPISLQNNAAPGIGPSIGLLAAVIINIFSLFHQNNFFPEIIVQHKDRNTNIFRLFWLNGASLFGDLKPQPKEKRRKIGSNPLILFVDSTLELLYSHRHVGKSGKIQITTR